MEDASNKATLGLNARLEIVHFIASPGMYFSGYHPTIFIVTWLDYALL